jgi:hypothetical protein
MRKRVFLFPLITFVRGQGRIISPCGIPKGEPLAFPSLLLPPEFFAQRSTRRASPRACPGCGSRALANHSRRQHALEVFSFCLSTASKSSIAARRALGASSRFIS